MIFNVDAAYTATTYLAFNAGALRDHSTTSTTTLSTLTLPSSFSSLQTMYYGAAAFNYLITRNVQYRAGLREQLRIDNSSKTDNRTHTLNMNLDYRIRMILVGLEYVLQEDIPSNSLRTQQQSYLAKISRPF
jgi:hypothetical protein